MVSPYVQSKALKQSYGLFYASNVYTYTEQCVYIYRKKGKKTLCACIKEAITLVLGLHTMNVAESIFGNFKPISHGMIYQQQELCN